MNEFVESSLFFGAFVSVGAYMLGVLVKNKLKLAILNPLLVAIVLVIGLLLVGKIDYSAYNAGAKYLSWLLTPATVCLAIPMYQHFSVLKKNLPAILAGIVAGSVTSLVFVAVWGLLLRYDQSLIMSLLPKSVTSAIGAPLAQMNGGLIPITTAVIIITGIFGNIAGPLLCRLFRITGEVPQGVAYGTAAHVIGTAKANELSALTGAVASLSLVTAGLVTAIFFPIVTTFLA